RAREAGRAQMRGEPVEVVRRQPPALRRRAAEADAVVERDADAQRGEARALALISGEQELDRPAEVGRGVHQPAAFGEPLEHEVEIGVLEIAEPAVNQLRRLAGGLGGEVARIAERDIQAAQRRIPGRRRAAGAAAHDQQIEDARREALQRRRPPRGRRHSLRATCSSSSWRFETGPGASVIRSVPFCVFGNAITSRSESAPHRGSASGSTPAAIPRWRGGPYLNASSRKPNFACASSSLSPSARNTRAWTSERWIRIDPPAISLPFSTRS